MTWHYNKRLINFRQDTHIEIIYECERGKCSHFCIQNLRFLSWFLLVLLIFCRYNMTFNREILGGGMIIQAIPHLRYWGGGGYIPPSKAYGTSFVQGGWSLLPEYYFSPLLARKTKWFCPFARILPDILPHGLYAYAPPPPRSTPMNVMSKYFVRKEIARKECTRHENNVSGALRQWDKLLLNK